MSGYLARLSARAVGRGASAHPRLPARFETPTLDPAPDADLVGPQPGPPDPPVERRPDGTVGMAPAPRNGLASARSTPAAPDGAEPMPPPHQPPGTAQAPVLAAAGLPTVLTTAQEPSPSSDPADAATRPSAPWAATSERGREPSAPRVAPGSVSVVAAVPVTAAPAPSAAAPAERETVVRVHIGRVDVRAQLTSPPVKAGKAEKADPGPGTLDLHDYLRGARESR